MNGCRMNNCVMYLRQLPLAYLDLADSDLDDTGLQELSAIKTLRFLDIRRTNVTSMASKAFQEARPDVFLTL